MVLNRFRAFADKLSKGPVDFFVRHNVTPNKLSLIGFAINSVVAILFYMRILEISYLHWTIPFLFFTAGAFDAFDGSVARKMNLVTKYGGFLDSTLDRYSDAILLLGIAAGGYFDANNYLDSTGLRIQGVGIYLGFWAMISCLMVSYIRSAAERGGVDMKGVGFMERGERIILIFFGTIIYGTITLVYNLGYGPPVVGIAIANEFFFWFLIVFTILTNVTIVQRVVYAVQNLNRIDHGLPPRVKGQKTPPPASPATGESKPGVPSP